MKETEKKIPFFLAPFPWWVIRQASSHHARERKWRLDFRGKAYFFFLKMGNFPPYFERRGEVETMNESLIVYNLNTILTFYYIVLDGVAVSYSVWSAFDKDVF